MLKEKNEHSNTFLVVKHHSICMESKEYREGWIQISPINPRTGEPVTKYIKPFDSVSGFVNQVEWYDRTSDSSDTRFVGYKLHIQDGDEEYILDLPYKSIGYQYFTKSAENINWNLPIEFSAWHNKKEDRTAFCARQNGETIKHKYTMANPGECPAPIQRKAVGGTVKWDFTDQEVWLKERIDRLIVPAVAKAAQNRAAFHAQMPTEVEPERELYEGSEPVELYADEIPF